MRWLPVELAIGILATGLCGAVSAEPLTIDFQGQIDGSDRIEVYPTQANWTHNLWKWPSEIYLNGVAWDPNAARDLYMPDLIPADISRYSARVDLRNGRDVAVAEIREDHLLIHLCDTLGGSDFYDFQVVLTEKPDPTPSPFADLRIQGYMDGSDRLVLTDSVATWENRYWHAPDEISLNGAVWDLQSQLTLPNSGDARQLKALRPGSNRVPTVAG